MFSGLESPVHLLIVLVIILLLFGAKRIPELAKGLGTGIREFKEGMSSKDEPSRSEAVEKGEKPDAEAAREEQREKATRAEGPGSTTHRENP